MTQIQPQPGIMQIELYQGGAAHVEGMTDVVVQHLLSDGVDSSAANARLARCLDVFTHAMVDTSDAASAASN